MAKAPAKQKTPPLVDSPHAPEIFVSEVVGAGVIGGCVSINLASHRWTVPEAGKEPEFTRVVVGRLILSGEAALQLARHLSQLSQARTAAAGQAPAAGRKPSNGGRTGKPSGPKK